MGIKEKNIINQTLALASKLGGRLFRCNTGTAWQGKRIGPVPRPTTITLDVGDIVLKKPRPFNSGWPKGTSDIIGFTPVTITNNMVGQQFAVFTAYEVKTKNLKPTKEQRDFISMVNKFGGIAKVIYEPNNILRGKSGD